MKQVAVQDRTERISRISQGIKSNAISDADLLSLAVQASAKKKKQTPRKDTSAQKLKGFETSICENSACKENQLNQSEPFAFGLDFVRRRLDELDSPAKESALMRHIHETVHQDAENDEETGHISMLMDMSHIYGSEEASPVKFDAECTLDYERQEDHAIVEHQQSCMENLQDDSILSNSIGYDGASFLDSPTTSDRRYILQNSANRTEFCSIAVDDSELRSSSFEEDEDDRILGGLQHPLSPAHSVITAKSARTPLTPSTTLSTLRTQAELHLCQRLLSEEATFDELCALKGIGKVRANRLLALRRGNESVSTFEQFDNLDDILEAIGMNFAQIARFRRDNFSSLLLEAGTD